MEIKNSQRGLQPRSEQISSLVCSPRFSHRWKPSINRYWSNCYIYKLHLIHSRRSVFVLVNPNEPIWKLCSVSVTERRWENQSVGTAAVALASCGVAVLEDIGLINQSSTKRTIIEQARQWPTYFCRLFPVSVWSLRVLATLICVFFLLIFQMPKYQSGQVQMIGISHLGVRLIKRNRTKTTNDTLQVLETFSFDQIQQISPLRSASTLEVRMGKKRLTIHSHRVNVLSTSRSRLSSSIFPDSKDQTNHGGIPQWIPARASSTISSIESGEWQDCFDGCLKRVKLRSKGEEETSAREVIPEFTLTHEWPAQIVQSSEFDQL